MKGYSRWFLLMRDGYPKRPGVYQCGAKLFTAGPVMSWNLEFDGVGFLVPIPMIVHQWRGLTEQEYKRRIAAQGGAR